MSASTRDRAMGRARAITVGLTVASVAGVVGVGVLASEGSAQAQRPSDQPVTATATTVNDDQTLDQQAPQTQDQQGQGVSPAQGQRGSRGQGQGPAATSGGS